MSGAWWSTQSYPNKKRTAVPTTCRDSVPRSCTSKKSAFGSLSCYRDDDGRESGDAVAVVDDDEEDEDDDEADLRIGDKDGDDEEDE